MKRRGLIPVMESDRERFATVLREDEELLTAGLGVHFQSAERYGRGQGEGLFALSNLRILFAFDNPIESPYLGIPRSLIIGATSNWVPYPKMRGLGVLTEIEGDISTSMFYVSKLMANNMVEILGPPK